MAFDGADGKADGRSDLLVAHAAGQHLQDLDFARGERRAGKRMFVSGLALAGVVNESVDQRERQLAGKVGPIPLDLTHGAEEFGIGVGFEHVTVGATAQGFAGDILGKVHGQDQYIGVGGSVADLADGFEAVHFRHGEVEQDHIGLEFLDEFEGFEAVAGLVADFNARLRFQQSANAAAHDGVVVGDENPIGFGLGVLFWHQFGHHVSSPSARWEAKPEWWCRRRRR